MATDLIHRTAGLPDQLEAERTWKLAQKICTTDMVPTGFRGKPEQVLAAMLAGREVGLSPMEALRSFHVIEGKPSMSAELMMTLALRAGHDLWVSEASRDRAVVTARHRDWPEDRTVQVEFTIEDAGDAGLTGKGNWKKYRRAMLRSRAVSEAVRQVCPEVLVGATYTAEELGASVSGPTGVPDGHDPDDWTGDADPAVVEVLTDDQDDEGDVVEAELVDDPPEPEHDVEATPDDRMAVFDDMIAELDPSGDFAASLAAEGKLDGARQFAGNSDAALELAVKRLRERHSEWAAIHDVEAVS